ncbi:MAG TPA: chaperone modulator CbpM [Alphaproteobacteria bacterium]|jgi:chaperone modulatory protein CbpM
MPFTFEDMLTRSKLERRVLTAWIEEGWVAPARDGEGYSFDEVDAARVGFIVELTQELAIGEEAVPVVLSLVDQLNALHITVRKVLEAIEDLPEPGRGRIAALLTEIDRV